MQDVFKWLADQSDRAAWPPSVGYKFHANGEVRYFPGNTIICPLTRAEPGLCAAVSLAQDRLKAAAFAAAYSFLPPDSFHMTMFEGVLEEKRRPELWPADLPLDAPLDEVTAHFATKLRTLPFERTFWMRCRGLSLSASGGLQIDLVPADAASEQTLSLSRDRLADLLQYRAPNHASYGFHISLAYLVKWLADEQLELLRAALAAGSAALARSIDTVTLGPAYLTRFDTMYRFEPVLALGDRE